MSTCKYTESVEKWGTFEAEMPGKHEGNPFTAVSYTHLTLPTN